MSIAAHAKFLDVARSNNHRSRALAPVAREQREPGEGCSRYGTIGHGYGRDFVKICAPAAVNTTTRVPLAGHVVLIGSRFADAIGNFRLALESIGGRVLRARSTGCFAALPSVGVERVRSTASLLCARRRAEVTGGSHRALGCGDQICRVRKRSARAWKRLGGALLAVGPCHAGLACRSRRVALELARAALHARALPT
eukprot:4225371-Prymnesium_polylepis.2